MKLFYLIYFILVNCFCAYSYIDPGTGSMLFAVLTGIISTLFFAGKTFFIKIKTLPFFFDKTRINDMAGEKDFVFYSEGKQYWNVFKPVIDEFSKRKIKISYYTSDQEDPGLNYDSEYVEAQFIGKGNKAYSKLNILEAEICLMTTPGLDVYQLERSKGVKHYSHILHAVDDLTLYKLFSFDYFDSVLLTGEYQKKDIRTLEKKRGTKEKLLYVAGCTYLDVLSEKIKNMNVEKGTDKKIVLVSPSWGENGLLRRYGLKLLIPLAESDYHIILRPHPQSSISEKDILDEIREGLKNYSNVEWDFERENLVSMIRSDIMISDFSGIMSDYWFLLGKPVMYAKSEFDKRAYDASDVEDEPWKFKALDELGIELLEKDFSDINKIINSSINNDLLLSKIKEAKNTAYYFPGQAGEKAADILLDIHKQLKEEK